MAIHPGHHGKFFDSSLRNSRGRTTRGTLRGRGRGSVRGRQVGNKNTFYSTRTEERLADGSEVDNTHSLPDDAQENGISELSSDSDNDINTNKIQPYNSLLESLKGESPNDAHRRKKVKLETTVTEEYDRRSVDSESYDAVEFGEPEEFGTEDFDKERNEEGYDPFVTHLDPGVEELEERVSALKQNKWSTTKSNGQSQWSTLCQTPQLSGASPGDDRSIARNKEALPLKGRLREPANRHLPVFDELTAHLASSVFHYRDVLFPLRNLENCETIRKLTCLHALNHIFKTRDRVIKNNARLSNDSTDEDLELRDQGFTRPKVLVLLPTRQSCVNYVETLISICEPEQQENKKRFQDSYNLGDKVSVDKPPDFQGLFNGNDDDMFRIGLKFTRKTIKYFAAFYNSDIILASPLGLRMALGADDPKTKNSDFLSSIEIVIMDQADAMLMQNWEHVEYTFGSLNLQPKEAHGCDFSRVRNWYLDGYARYLRQTILIAAFNFPSINRLYMQHLLNVAGKAKYSGELDGAITSLNISLKQTFSRFDSGLPTEEPENRFNYFKNTIVPSLAKSSRQDARNGQGVLVYLPTYPDFVRVRNFLAASSTTQDISFGSISEYTSVRDVARARSHFYSGRHAVLLYTERAHHFRRYHLKGVKRVILYGLPENPIFYTEVVGDFLAASVAAAKLTTKEANVRAIFSKLDAMKLERVVGTARCISMLKDKVGDIFDFV